LPGERRLALVLGDERGSSRRMMRAGDRGDSLRGVIARAQNTVGRLRGLDPVRVDALVAALFLAWAAVQVADALPDVRLADAVTDVAFAGAVAVRRRWLVQALLLLCVVMAGRYLLVGGHAFKQGGGGGTIAVMLLTYGCGAFLEGRRSWLGLGISLALVTGIALVKSSVLPLLFDDVAFALLPFLVGRARRLGRARELAERERAERLDSERELRVRTAALSERTRLAREIHDVIAHSVSVMVIQAAGARTVMDSDPARAESALRSVERAGREALAEMRRLLGVLGDGEHLRELAPQPGLEDLPELVSSTRVAGLNASILVEGDPVAVSQGLSLCAYRVVQEALTNTLKHVGPTRAEVHLRWREDALEVLVSDDGRAAARDLGEPVVGSSGHGITGMRERAALHGGSIEAGAAADGGFVVRARIPLAVGSAS
jgi:signal transduction histidine kinase